jgi:hypothetical protein
MDMATASILDDAGRGSEVGDVDDLSVQQIRPETVSRPGANDAGPTHKSRLIAHSWPSWLTARQEKIKDWRSAGWNTK